MSKKTFFLITLLTLSTFFLFYFAILKDKQQRINSERSILISPTLTPVQKSTEIYFQPSIITISNKISSISSSFVFINANSNMVSSVQLEMSFDPKSFLNIDINPPNDMSFLGENNKYKILFKNIDYKNGRISYALELNKNESPRSGIGKLAVISFTPNIKSNQKNTEIKLLEKTTVTQPEVGQSVLKDLSTISINFGQTMNASPSEQFCAQIIQPAKNPQTGECKLFSTPCDVPAEWIKVSNCNVK